MLAPQSRQPATLTTLTDLRRKPFYRNASSLFSISTGLFCTVPMPHPIICPGLFLLPFLIIALPTIPSSSGPPLHPKMFLPCALSCFGLKTAALYSANGPAIPSVLHPSSMSQKFKSTSAWTESGMIHVFPALILLHARVKNGARKIHF